MLTKTKALFKAMSDNDVDTVNALLDVLDVNADAWELRLELASAARKGHTGVICAFITHDNVDVTPHIHTMCNMAARNGKTEVVGMLLDFTDTDMVHATLHAAIEKGHEGIVEKVMKDERLRVPALHAAETGHTKLIDILLNHPEFDVDDSVLKSMCTRAASNGHTQIVQAILDFRFTVGMVREAMHIAVENGHEGVVCALMSHGSAASFAEDDRCAMMKLARTCKHRDILELLEYWSI